jgi:hypothetical protein
MIEHNPLHFQVGKELEENINVNLIYFVEGQAHHNGIKYYGYHESWDL